MNPLNEPLFVKALERVVRGTRRSASDTAVDYQPWVVANFSGVLCVDEVYQGDLALLLAVDPAAPDGDRLVGYTLLPKTKEVDQGMVRTFIDRLVYGQPPAVLVPRHTTGSPRRERRR